jgi:transcriptional regulator with XRE-family HTH domain
VPVSADTDVAKFGRLVRQRREYRGWSQEALAAAAFSNATRKGYISQIENGKIPNITRETVRNVARVLEIALDDIPPALRWPEAAEAVKDTNAAVHEMQRQLDRLVATLRDRFQEFRIKEGMLTSCSLGKPPNVALYNKQFEIGEGRLPGVYLSTFDLQHDEDMDAFIGRAESWYVKRMFFYGALFRFVAFQWSAALKNPNSGRAFLRFQECFERDENSPAGVFRITTRIQSFEFNVQDRMSFFSSGDRPIEWIAYEKSNAAECGKHLDRQLLRIHASLSDVRNEISQRVSQFVVGSNLNANDERVLLSYSRPETFQTNILIDIAKRQLRSRNKIFQQVLGATCRREYNRGNARIANALSEFEHPIWDWSSVSKFARAVGIDILFQRAIGSQGRTVSHELLAIRLNDAFLFLRGEFFACQTRNDLDILLDTLLLQRRNMPILGFEDCRRAWDLMRESIVRLRVRVAGN